MKLLYQTHSPYARKVLVAAHEMGIAHDIEVIHHETSPLLRNDEVLALNPLGKVPVLIDVAGTVLFDSDVICEYLDGRHAGPRLIPPVAPQRFRALRMQAIAQGIADAGIAVRWEDERRPEHLRWPAFRDGQLQKISLACDFAEGAIDPTRPLDIGDVALATALSWIEFRDVFAFAPGRPRLADWYARFSERPSMHATRLSGDTHDQ
jgi:glutathione S-transferase